MKKNLKRWKDLIINDKSNLKDAIESLNKNDIKIILILDQKNKLLGTISDGDVRRGLLKGLTFKDSVIKIMNKDYLSVKSTENKKKVYKLMNDNKIHQIPVLDKNKEIIDIYCWDDFFSTPKINNPMVIMAGGMGKRLMPMTKSLPKSMIKIGKKPILEHIIIKAREEGFKKFFISVFYKAEIIEKYFGNGNKFGVKIRYIKENKPLGTIGALSLIKNNIKNDFILTNCDVLTDIKYLEILNFHQRTKSNLTISVKKYEIQNPYGVVSLNGTKVKGFDEKPIIQSNINAGIYVLNKKVLSDLKFNTYCDFPEFLNLLLNKKNSVSVFPIFENWIDIGSPNDLGSAFKKIND